MKKQWDALWLNAHFVTCEQGYGAIEQGALAVKDGKISWIDSLKKLPAHPESLANTIYDLENRYLVTPSFIDCHTHVVYAGNRANEFEMRLQGATYEDITRKGGGILSTVKTTRTASEAELLEQSLERVLSLMASGVTTIEIKSGYGLDLATELKILAVAKEIGKALPITVYKTFLGAHIIPPEYKDHPDDYVDLICNEMIPYVAKEKLADAVDVFCEKIAFNLAQTEKIFKAAKKNNLAIKCHSEQLSNLGSAELAAKYHALSIDHLEHVSEEGVKAISQSGTIAVLLPGAFYFLREKSKPPIAWLRDYNVPIALATDCNPGTSPIQSALVILNMACVLFQLTPEEALLGMTLHAAKALGLEKSTGSLTINKVADFAIWEVQSPADLAYYLGNNPLKQLVKAGEIILNN